MVGHAIIANNSINAFIASSINIGSVLGSVTATNEIKSSFSGLKSLAIKNFRALADFKVGKLGRVNLIVGKNNSGKSSVLEALRIYAGNGQEHLMQEIAASHDERFQFDMHSESERPETLPYAAFFTGWRLPPDGEKGLCIGENVDDEQTLAINVQFHTPDFEYVKGDSGDSGSFSTQIPIDVLRSLPLQKVKLKLLAEKCGKEILPMQFAALLKGRELNRYVLSETIPCSIVPTRFVSFDELAKGFDQVTLPPNEVIVNDALKLITPEFAKLSFVKADENGIRQQGDIRRTAIVRLAGVAHPVPINGMGDGMLRILQLALKVFPAKDGFLLIDEFENGLHYSVQEKVWRMVFDLAEKLNIQVFATTHSWDCITSFAKVARQRENDDGILFRVGRSVRTSDRGRVIATVFSGARLFDLTQADIEVR